MVVNRYDCQIKNILEVIDVKEHIWLTNVKYLWLSPNTFGHLYFGWIHTCVQFKNLFA